MVSFPIISDVNALREGVAREKLVSDDQKA